MLGLLMMAGGIWMLVDEQSLQGIVDSFKSNSTGDASNIVSTEANSTTSVTQLLGEIYSHEYFDYFLIVVGGVTVLISFFGFCGAKKESVGLIGTYICFTILLLLLQIAALVIINLRLDSIQTFKESVDKAVSIDFNDLEGDGIYQTVFFGILAVGSLLVLFVSFCFCHSVRKQNTGQYNGV